MQPGRPWSGSEPRSGWRTGCRWLLATAFGRLASKSGTSGTRSSCATLDLCRTYRRFRRRLRSHLDSSRFPDCAGRRTFHSLPFFYSLRVRKFLPSIPPERHACGVSCTFRANGPLCHSPHANTSLRSRSTSFEGERSAIRSAATCGSGICTSRERRRAHWKGAGSPRSGISSPFPCGRVYQYSIETRKGSVTCDDIHSSGAGVVLQVRLARHLKGGFVPHPRLGGNRGATQSGRFRWRGYRASNDEDVFRRFRKSGIPQRRRYLPTEHGRELRWTNPAAGEVDWPEPCSGVPGGRPGQVGRLGESQIPPG